MLVQAETRTALANLEEIAAVDGVDGVFIGPSDLAADFGHLGNFQAPEVWNAIMDAGARIRKAGKAAGFLSARDEDIRRTMAGGFNFIACGSDAGILARQSETIAKTYRDLAAKV